MPVLFGSVEVSEKTRNDTDQHRQSTSRNRPSSYWDMAEFFDFLQIALDVGDGNRADLPVSLSSDAFQHQRTIESDRRFKHHLAVQSSFLQTGCLVGQ